MEFKPKLVRIKTRKEIEGKRYLQTQEFVKYLWRIGLINWDWQITFEDLGTMMTLPKELIAPLPEEWDLCRVFMENGSAFDSIRGVRAKFKNIVDSSPSIPQAYLVELENGKLFATSSIIFDEKKDKTKMEEYCGFIYVEDLITDHKNLKMQIKEWEKVLDRLQKTEDINELKREIDRIANEMMAVNM